MVKTAFFERAGSKDYLEQGHVEWIVGIKQVHAALTFLSGMATVVLDVSRQLMNTRGGSIANFLFSILLM